ncbi:MAG: hypothetical protein PHQ40_00345 [Anaerolineaceae bacterium]|nr:hypothetical protein [Anaerolineaceae bacterium]MDD5367505.1 hypothetical protein [Anaerolineaceae bacterium]
MKNDLGGKSIEDDARRLRVLMAQTALPGLITGTAWGVIVLMNGDGTPAKTFPPTATGLDTALAEATYGDLIWVPPGNYAGARTIPAGVGLASMGNKTMLTGTVTLGGANSHLLGINVNVIGNSSDPIIAVVAPPSGIAYINDCMALGTNNGSGVGASMQASAGRLEAWNCICSGISIGGEGWAVLGADGVVHVEGGRLYGSSGIMRPSAGTGTTTTTITTGVGIGKILPSVPVDDWKAVVYDDSAWQSPIISNLGAGYPNYITHDTKTAFDSAYRMVFTLGAGTLTSAVLSIIQDDDCMGVWINGTLAWEGANGIVTRVITLDETLFTPGADNCIAVQFHSVGGDPLQSFTWLGFTLTLESTGAVGVYNLETSCVEMTVPVGEPLQGDRSVWDALGYQVRHANDLDHEQGIHWSKQTLDSLYGTGSEFVVFASRAGAALDTNLTSGGGTDDTAVLQSILNKASPGSRLLLILDGPTRVSGLDIYSNTTLWCLDGCGFFQTANSNRALLRNAHRSRTTITDEHITIIGGTYNQNKANQHGTGSNGNREADNTLICGMTFYGTNYLTIQDVYVVNHVAFGVHIGNANFINIDNLHTDHGIGGLNGDGLHLNGPMSFVYGHNLKLNSWDDALALCAGDGNMLDMTLTNDGGPYLGQGVMTDVIIDGVEFQDCLQGIRLLSHDANTRMDRIQIHNVTGTVTNNLLHANTWFAGAGDFGQIVIDGVDVTWGAGVNVGNGLPTELCMIWGHFEILALRNFKIHKPSDNRNILHFFPETDIHLLEIDGFDLYDTTVGVNGNLPILLEGSVEQLRGSRWNWYRTGQSQAPHAFLEMPHANSHIGTLKLNGAFIDLTDHLLDQTAGTVDNIQASHIRHDNAGGNPTFVIGAGTLAELNLSNYSGGTPASGTITSKIGDAFALMLATKLDDLAAPDDNTDLNASTVKHGLMQRYPGGTTTFLRADGAWVVVSLSGGEVLMQDGVSSPPVPVESEDGSDWLYQG